jgi:hypothetical protein
VVVDETAIPETTQNNPFWTRQLLVAHTRRVRFHSALAASSRTKACATISRT